MVLRLENVCFNKILKGISFDIRENELAVITGPNGSGKSTLAKCIMGINKISGGQIIFDDDDITDKAITERAKLGIAFAFQQPVKIKGVTVRDLLVAAGAEKPEKYLEMVGLVPEEYLDREISGSLSGGELKRIEIASVLARDSKLMIFDEPEAGIDLWSFDNLVDVFKKLKKNHSIIIISHQERIIRLADRVLVLEKGKISRECTADEFLKGVK
jgi:Fe-S cluster assembly ATP-binding protein